MHEKLSKYFSGELSHSETSDLLNQLELSPNPNFLGNRNFHLLEQSFG